MLTRMQCPSTSVITLWVTSVKAAANWLGPASLKTKTTSDGEWYETLNALDCNCVTIMCNDKNTHIQLYTKCFVILVGKCNIQLFAI